MLECDANGVIPPRLTRYTVGRARIERRPGAVRLVTEDAVAGDLADAQLDDYHGRPRDMLPWRQPVAMYVRARWSHPAAELRGTTGFGFWNDPLDERGRFVASPSYLWFFHASPPSRMRLRDRVSEGGFVAAAMAGPEVGRATLAAGNLALRLPGVERVATRLGERRARSDDVLLPEDLDLTGWHDYAIHWAAGGARFAVDGAPMATLPDDALPRCPLGFVAWIDNNWMAFAEDGSFRGARLAAPGTQWLELTQIELRAG